MYVNRQHDGGHHLDINNAGGQWSVVKIDCPRPRWEPPCWTHNFTSTVDHQSKNLLYATLVGVESFKLSRFPSRRTRRRCGSTNPNWFKTMDLFIQFIQAWRRGGTWSITRKVTLTLSDPWVHLNRPQRCFLLENQPQWYTFHARSFNWIYVVLQRTFTCWICLVTIFVVSMIIISYI